MLFLWDSTTESVCTTNKLPEKQTDKAIVFLSVYKSNAHLNDEMHRSVASHLFQTNAAGFFLVFEQMLWCVVCDGEPGAWWDDKLCLTLCYTQRQISPWSHVIWWWWRPRKSNFMCLQDEFWCIYEAKVSLSAGVHLCVQVMKSEIHFTCLWLYEYRMKFDWWILCQEQIS